MRKIVKGFLSVCGFQPAGFSMGGAEVRQELPPPPPGPTPAQMAHERRQAEDRAHYERVMAETRAQAERATQELRWAHMKEAEQRRAQDMNDAERRNFEKMNEEARRQSGGDGGGGSSGDGGWYGGNGPTPGNSDFASRRFNYERQAQYPWIAEQGTEQYKQIGKDKWLTPWGRTLSTHAVEDMQKRDICARHVEKTIAYGRQAPYQDYNDRHRRELGAFIVGVVSNEQVVISTFRDSRLKKHVPK